MKLTSNFEKKHVFVFTFFLVLVAGIFIVRSYDPAQGWHSASQIDFSQGLNVQQGGGLVKLGDDANPYMELRATDGSGTPYIDLINDGATDYDARLILTGDNMLQIQGTDISIANGNLQVSGTVNVGYEIRTASGNGAVTAYCTSGKKLLSGTCTPLTGAELRTSQPRADGSGWDCTQLYTGYEPQITATAICARIA